MNKDSEQRDALKQRMKAFAVKALRFCDEMPRCAGSWAIARQLTKSSTSVGANYRAACRARSTAESLAKLGIVEEEADETVWWLELAKEAGYGSPAEVEVLIDEARQLLAIVITIKKIVRRTSRGYNT